MVVAVLQGSVRTERLGERVEKWVIAELTRRGHEVVLVDAAELDLPMLNQMWKEIKDAPDGPAKVLYDKLKPLADLYQRVDGFAVVSAEYNHCAPPALINLIDYFLEEYYYRPSAIVCYSKAPYGGVRAAMQLRSFLAEVGMGSIPTLMPVPAAGDSVSEDGIALTQQLAEKSEAFFDEFDWYMSALKVGRAGGVPTQN